MRLFIALCISLAVVFGTARQIQAESPEKLIYLVNYGWHVGIALPVDDTVRRALPDIARFLDAAVLEIGWGDADFYRAKNPTTAMALAAALQPGPTVLHIHAVRQPLRNTFPAAEILAIPTNDVGFGSLLTYIAHSFDLNDRGQPKSRGAGLYGPDRSWFYAATGEFHIFRTCNRWTAEAMAAAGLAIEPSSVITASTLMDAARTALTKRQK